MKKYNLCYLDILKPLCFALLITFAGCRGSKVGESPKAEERKKQEVAGSKNSSNNVDNTVQTTSANMENMSAAKALFSKQPIKFDRDSSNKKIKAHFVSGKTFDYYENNPYNYLNYPVRGKNYGEKMYDVNGKLKDLLPTVDNKYLNTELITDSSNITALSTIGGMGYNLDSTFFIAKYVLFAWTKDGIPAANTTIAIMDTQGNLLKKLENIGVAADGVSITSDLKYIGFVFLGGGEFNAKGGFMVYDLNTMEKVYEDNGTYVDCIIKNNMFFLISDHYYRDIVDLERKKRYTRLFSEEERDDIILVDSIGYKMGKKSSNVRYLLFEKDFKVATIDFK